MGRRPSIARIALPATIAAGLAWAMVGCVYLPWFEQVQLTGSRRDFRPLSGRLADGRITKRQVIAILGEPLRRSSNDLVWAYALTTSHGIWVEPLCFHATPGGRHVYALGLRFNRDGVLEHDCLVREDARPMIGAEGLMSSPESDRESWLTATLLHVDRDNGVRFNPVTSVVPGIPLDQQPPSGVRLDYSVVFGNPVGTTKPTPAGDQGGRWTPVPDTGGRN